MQLQHTTNLNIQRSQSTQRFFHNALIAYAYTPSTDNQLAMSDQPSTSAATANNCAALITNQQNYDTNKEIENTEELGAVGGCSPREDIQCESKENLHELNEEANLALQQQQRNEDTNYDNTINAEQENNSLEVNNNQSNVTTALGAVEIDDYRDHSVDVEEEPINVEVYNDRLSFLRQLHLQRRQEQQRLQQQYFNLENNSSSSSTQFDSMQSIASIERKDCEYFKLVQQFRSSLVLPDSFFQTSVEPICFCTHCNAQASEKLHGWVYFKLNQQTVNSNSSTQHALDSDLHGDWLPLFYMTRVDKIRAILDHGQPLPMDTNGETHNHASGTQKDEPGTRLELHFTPNSTAIIPINQQHKYHFNGQAYKINTAFEVYVRRQSLCASSKSNANDAAKLHEAERRSSTSDVDLAGSSSSSNAAGGGHNSNTAADSYAGPSTSLSSAPVIKDQTWFTKEAGACVITALILKLDKLPTNDLY